MMNYEWLIRDSQMKTYREFIEHEIAVQRDIAIGFGYDAPTIEPVELYEQEAYLQEILGFIQFTLITNTFYRSRGEF
jgi:hypothetical protein